MCDTCGCNVTDGNRHLVSHGGALEHTASGTESVAVLKSLLDANDHAATHNREHFDRHGVLAINLMSSPGAGKTALLEETIIALNDEFRVAVIEGDLDTENDAERIRAQGVPAIQISTGSACHLDAHMIHRALHQLDLTTLDIVFIENVGNLVCPASFDLGQHRNVTLLSSPEGDDKPAKYPVMFRAADLMLLTKSDLIEVLGDFDPKHAVRLLRDLANPAPAFRVSSRNGEGMEEWLAWLRQTAVDCGDEVTAGHGMRPAIQKSHLVEPHEHS
jgi:hydrogenase nickel incorporation protein HypB